MITKIENISFLNEFHLSRLKRSIQHFSYRAVFFQRKYRSAKLYLHLHSLQHLPSTYAGADLGGQSGAGQTRVSHWMVPF